MKLIGPVAVFAVLFSLPVPGLAQVAKPAAAPAQPAAKPAAAPMQAEAKPAAVKLASGSAGRSRANEDARSCLEFATNTEIARCAEKYR